MSEKPMSSDNIIIIFGLRAAKAEIALQHNKLRNRIHRELGIIAKLIGRQLTKKNKGRTLIKLTSDLDQCKVFSLRKYSGLAGTRRKAKVS
jgi:hypothetical protein